MTFKSVYTLNNGKRIPAVGLGVYLTKPEDTADAVETAIKAGYRLIDTAAAYQNEEQVGQGIRKSGINREELFVTTKLWIADHGFDNTLRAFHDSLERLGLDYIDMYMIHWPVPSSFTETLAAWRAMEALYEKGKIKTLGVCNFQPDHLENLISNTVIPPAVNQIELHPFFNQNETRLENARYGILTQCWSPIGGIYTNHPSSPDNPVKLLEHEVIGRIASRIGKSPAQVVLRWHLQHGFAVIPKSVIPERIHENISLADFLLSEADMWAIDTLATDQRGGADPDIFDMAFLNSRQK